ncbi:MAG TPA: ABC transporter permease, partial [Blastocatellia bacterium]|nr:ABC transporter permease [Blastocatellia bacterium]
MIKHLIKIVWNRKRTNLLVTVEIFFSFLVLFAVAVIAIYYIDNYRQPLGFNYQNVWNITVRITSRDSDKDEKNAQIGVFRQVMAGLKDIDGIEHIATDFSSPYSTGNWTTSRKANGRSVEYHQNTVTPDFKDVLDLQVVKGRWFGKDDTGLDWQPVVITQKLATDLYGSDDPLGKEIIPGDKPSQRVIGVISEYRKDGEYSAPVNFLFQLQDMYQPKSGLPQSFVIKVRPGSNAVLEEKIINTAQSIAKDWSFHVQPITEMRETMNSVRLAPVIAIGLIAGFLMIMVALGLIGVLWQNVTQRTREIGLRRAKGATAGNIYKQILGELIIIASFGLIVGTIVIAQFPLLD